MKDLEKAKYVIDNANPHFKTKEEYLNYIDSLFTDKEAVIYNDDGTVTLDI